MQNGHGLQQDKPFAKFSDIVAKVPKSWGTALELCRRARAWTQKQLIAEALGGENVTVSDVKRWELAKAQPTLNQAHKLRRAMPDLLQYDELLPLMLRETPRAKKAVPPPPVAPEGWPGPPVSHFGQALKWARVHHGMSQRDVAVQVGVSTISPWENNPNIVMVRGTYERLCDSIFPELRLAPPPKFSARWTNQPRTKGYLISEEHHQEASRAQRVVAPAAPVAPPQANAAPSSAPLNSAGAQYGVLVAEVMSLEAEQKKMEARHLRESQEMEGRITKARAEVETASQHMRSTAHALHGGMP